MDKELTKYFTLRYIAAFVLLMFCVQYLPVEGRSGVSIPKSFAVLLCVPVFFVYTMKISRAVVLFGLYYFFVILAAVLHPETLRAGTLLYLASFLFMYVTYYNLITVEKVFDRVFFIKLLKIMIIAFAVVLIIQQLLIVCGIEYCPLVNMTYGMHRGLSANSLSNEPSYVAQLMAVAYLSLLRMSELKYGRILSLKEIFKENKLSTIAFLWIMLTLFSGTAIMALCIVGLYFLKKRYLKVVVPVIIALLTVLLFVEFNPLERVVDSVAAFFTFDNEKIIEADASAAWRTIPVSNTLTNLDLSDVDTWFGHGVDYQKEAGQLSEIATIGMIGDYGLVSFIIMQIIAFCLFIKRFFSGETVLWVVLFGATFCNIPYIWGAVMILTAVRHFQTEYEHREPGILEV